MNENIAERRLNPRVSFSHPVRVRSTRGVAPCRAANLSETGILLLPERAVCLPPDPFLMHFALPRTGGLTVEGRLARYTLTSEGPSWGVEFTRAAPKVAEQISAFVGEMLEPPLHLPDEITVEFEPEAPPPRQRRRRWS